MSSYKYLTPTRDAYKIWQRSIAKNSVFHSILPAISCGGAFQEQTPYGKSLTKSCSAHKRKLRAGLPKKIVYQILQYFLEELLGTGRTPVELLISCLIPIKGGDLPGPNVACLHLFVSKIFGAAKTSL